MARVTLHCNHWKSSHSCIKFNLPFCYSHFLLLLLTQKTQQLKLHISHCYLLKSFSIRARIFLILHLHGKMCQGLIQHTGTALVSALCFSGVHCRQWKPILSSWRTDFFFFWLCLLIQSLPVAATSCMQTFSWSVFTIFNLINLISVPKLWSWTISLATVHLDSGILSQAQNISTSLNECACTLSPSLQRIQTSHLLINVFLFPLLYEKQDKDVNQPPLLKFFSNGQFPNNYSDIKIPLPVTIKQCMFYQPSEGNNFISYIKQELYKEEKKCASNSRRSV